MSNNQVQTESVNLAVAEENELGAVLPPSVGWHNLQPNSYASFASTFKKEPRNPISKNAQLQKGMLTDEDSGISFEMDVTKDSIDRFARGIFRSNPKHSGNTGQSLFAVEAVTSTGFTVAALGGVGQHFLVYSRGCADDANNGLFVVGSSSTSTSIKAAGLVAEPSPPANATVEIAGFRGVSGDIQLNDQGNLTSTLADFTTWGLQPYQWVSVGDPNNPDVSFLNPDFIGSARVRTIAAHLITFDRRNWLVEQFAYLDLGGITSDLDTVVEAVVAGASGDSVTVTAVDDGAAAVKASLDLSGVTTTPDDTVVQAKVAGAAGSAITVEFYPGAGSGAGVLTEVGTNVRIQYKAAVSTVANIETLIGTSTLIEVKTPGTGASVLQTSDAFPATALTGGSDADAPSVTEVSTAVTLHFTGSATTVAQMEAAIAAEATQIAVKTPGTAGHVLLHSVDEFSATALDHGTSGADAGTAKTIDVYFTRWYRNVATDNADYATPSYVFEVTYQTLDDGSPEYEYLLGNMVDNWVWDFSLTTKAKITAKFVGTRTLNPTTSRATGPSSALNPNVNLGVSTSTDLIRLQIADADEVGISTDFQSLKVTASNGVSPEKQLGQLGASKMNLGQHTAMIDSSLIFTSDVVIQAVRDNRTCNLATMMRNDDFGALLDVQSMTMDTTDRKLERQKAVLIDAKASGFQDQYSGSTESLSVFAYLPPLVSTADE